MLPTKLICHTAGLSTARTHTLHVVSSRSVSLSKCHFHDYTACLNACVPTTHGCFNIFNRKIINHRSACFHDGSTV